MSLKYVARLNTHCHNNNIHMHADKYVSTIIHGKTEIKTEECHRTQLQVA